MVTAKIFRVIVSLLIAMAMFGAMTSAFAEDSVIVVGEQDQGGTSAGDSSIVVVVPDPTATVKVEEPTPTPEPAQSLPEVVTTPEPEAELPEETEEPEPTDEPGNVIYKENFGEEGAQYSVRIACDVGEVVYCGDIITLKGIITGLAKDAQYSVIWWVDDGTGWAQVPGANELTYSFAVDAENFYWTWKLQVILANE